MVYNLQTNKIILSQSLYVVRAAQIGMGEDVTWLLHIDADELFYVDQPNKDYSGTAAMLFQKLSKKEFTHASFMNDENLPETPNFADKNHPKTPFHQRTLFKVFLNYFFEVFQGKFFKVFWGVQFF